MTDKRDPTQADADTQTKQAVRTSQICQHRKLQHNSLESLSVNYSKVLHSRVAEPKSCLELSLRPDD